MKEWWQVPAEKLPGTYPPPRLPGKPGRPRIRIFCEKCGKDIGWGHRQHYCMDCLAVIAADHARQMQEKKGPVYETWQRRRREAMLRELIEGGNAEGL